MAPLSKDTAGIILPFDNFRNHLDASNKTIDSELEIKNFEAAGKILVKIWSESIIDNHPVAASYTSPPEKEHSKVLFHKTEEWKAKHVRQSQYMLQILKCSDKSCCKQRKANCLEFFPQRFLPAPVPITTSENGLQIDRAKGKFQSLFQLLFLASSLKLDLCYDEYCPSLQEKNAESERITERRSCKICKLYHSRIVTMKEHKRVCKRSNKRRALESSDESDAEDDSEVESDDEGGSDAEIESNQSKEDPEPEQSVINGNRNIFEQISNFILLSFIFHFKKIVCLNLSPLCLLPLCFVLR